MTQPNGETCTLAPGCPHPPGHEGKCETPLDGLRPVDARNLRMLLSGQGFVGEVGPE